MQIEHIMHFYLYYRANQYSEGKKIKICKTLIRPLATYRAESWTLNKDIAKWLSTFERKVLRSMFGGIKLMKSGESTIMKN